MARIIEPRTHDPEPLWYMNQDFTCGACGCRFQFDDPDEADLSTHIDRIMFSCPDCDRRQWWLISVVYQNKSVQNIAHWLPINAEMFTRGNQA